MRRRGKGMGDMREGEMEFAYGKYRMSVEKMDTGI